MVVRLQTEEGVPVHVHVPRVLLGLLTTVLGTITLSLGALLVSNQQELADHRLRLEYIEATRFTAEDARTLDANFVTQRELALFLDRLQRIEDKVDRLLEGS